MLSLLPAVAEGNVNSFRIDLINRKKLSLSQRLPIILDRYSLLEDRAGNC